MSNPTRTSFWTRVCLGASLSALGAGCHQKDKAALTVGFAQEGHEGAWRQANTISVQESAKQGDVALLFNDGEGKQEAQIAAMKSFIAQHADVIDLAPVTEKGWDDILRQAKDANIPVIVSDRNVVVTDKSLQPPFIGSDIIEEGRKAGREMAKLTGDKAVIVRLEGTTGSTAAQDRTKGFDEVLAMPEHAGMKILISKSGDFKTDVGKSVMAAVLQSNRDAHINAVFAENDDMALGAIQALDEAGPGYVPGKDVKIVCVDGTKGGLQALIDGKINCVVECSPLLGPKIMETAKMLKDGKAVPPKTISEEKVFTDPAEVKAIIASRPY